MGLAWFYQQAKLYILATILKEWSANQDTGWSHVAWQYTSVVCLLSYANYTLLSDHIYISK